MPWTSVVAVDWKFCNFWTHEYNLPPCT